MKKRLALVLTLCFAVSGMLQGCGSSSQCVINVFPTGTNGQIYYATVLWACDGYQQRFRVGFAGDVFVPRRCAGQYCSGIYILNVTFSFTFSPSPYGIDLQSPPSSMTFENGGGIDTTYGPPQVAYFDDFGGYIGSGDVTGSGSSWVTTTLPNLSNVYSGSYTVQISNKQSDGSYVLNGEATGYTYNRDAPGGGGGGGEDPPPCGGGLECNAY